MIRGKKNHSWLGSSLLKSLGFFFQGNKVDMQNPRKPPAPPINPARPKVRVSPITASPGEPMMISIIMSINSHAGWVFMKYKMMVNHASNKPINPLHHEKRAFFLMNIPATIAGMMVSCHIVVRVINIPPTYAMSSAQ